MVWEVCGYVIGEDLKIETYKIVSEKGSVRQKINYVDEHMLNTEEYMHSKEEAIKKIKKRNKQSLEYELEAIEKAFNKLKENK